MKRLIILLKMLFLQLYIFSQTNFENGFRQGYTDGYCYEQNYCIEPILPIPPLPTIYESSNSYKDGYNNGFLKGLQLYKSKNNSQINSTYYYKQYESAWDIDKLSLALSNRQRQYDLNRASLQTKVNAIANLYYTFDTERVFSKSQKDFFDYFEMDLKNISLGDLSNSSIYYNRMNWLNSIYGEIMSWVQGRKTASSYQAQSYYVQEYLTTKQNKQQLLNKIIERVEIYEDSYFKELSKKTAFEINDGYHLVDFILPSPNGAIMNIQKNAKVLVKDGSIVKLYPYGTNEHIRTPLNNAKINNGTCSMIWYSPIAKININATLYFHAKLFSLEGDNYSKPPIPSGNIIFFTSSFSDNRKSFQVYPLIGAYRRTSCHIYDSESDTYYGKLMKGNIVSLNKVKRANLCFNSNQLPNEVIVTQLAEGDYMFDLYDDNNKKYRTINIEIKSGQCIAYDLFKNKIIVL